MHVVPVAMLIIKLVSLVPFANAAGTSRKTHRVLRPVVTSLTAVGHVTSFLSQPPDTLAQAALDAADPQFADLDCVDHDDVITVDEAATFGVKNGIPWSEIKPIFSKIDQNYDGQITLDEFNAQQPQATKMFQFPS